MKKQPNSTGPLSACHHFDNPIVYTILMPNQTSSDGFKPFSTNANNYP